MKTALVCILALIAIELNAQSDLPNQFELLKQNYDKAIERATRPITSKYIQELKSLKVEMLDAGNLKIANQAQAELTRLGEVELTLSDQLQRNSWNYPIDGKPTKVVFNENGTAQFSGYRNFIASWKLRDLNTVSITFPDKKVVEFNFEDLETLKSQTKLKGAGTRSLEVIVED